MVTQENQSKREFYVKTPKGTLHVHSKYDVDNELDYPGVYIDLIRDGREPEMLACVEYDSGMGDMLTTAYDIGVDEPVAYHHHELTCDDGEEQQKPSHIDGSESIAE